MSKKTIHIVMLIVCTLSFKATAQNNIPVLSWRTHFSYNNVNSVTLGDNKVFASADHGVFYVDLTDNSLELINKNNGLSDVDIAAIHYSEPLQQLVIGYKDGGIDFWERSGVESVTTVEEASIVGSKAYRAIQNHNGNIYFSGDLGIVVYETESRQIVESYLNLGTNGRRLAINELFFKNDSIYALSEDGILSALNSPSVNLLDFNNWNRTLTGLNFESIVEFEDTLYATSGSDIFLYEDFNWSYLASTPEDIQDLVVTQTRLTAFAGTTIFQKFGDRFLDVGNTPFSNIAVVENNNIWLGTKESGLGFQILGIRTNSYLPKGPRYDMSEKSFLFNHSIYFLNAAAYSYLDLSDMSWPLINDYPESNLVDLEFTVTLPPELQAPLIADFNRGLFEPGSSRDLLFFYSDNSTIQRVDLSYSIQSMEGLGNELWFTIRNSNTPLHKWNIITDSWSDYELENRSAQFSTDLFIAQNGDKWITIEESEGGGIVVYNEISGRERYLNLNGAQGGLPGRLVNDLTYDQDGFLWIATNGGIAFYPNPDDVLDGRSLTASIPIFNNRLLLRNEHLTGIAIDPANRKWIGSLDNGLWLFSETGEELIYHFTKENSPLPSNRINDLSINPTSGELFISTDKGIVSFRGDATEGQSTHANIKIYPNPVAPGYQGNIILEGLVNNANVKITDVSGKLVKEIRANGSTALWNTRDLSNARVSTGVYLVFSSNRDGSETYIGKIVVI